MPASGRIAAVRTALWEDFGSGRLAFVLAICIILSLEILFQPDLLVLWSVTDVALVWIQELLELVAVASAYVLVVALVRQISPEGPVRFVLLVVAVAVTSLAVAASQAWSAARPGQADLQAVTGDALLWGLLAGFMVGIDALNRRARRLHADARVIATAREQLSGGQSSLELQLLQAQIEPHFLFNTLANVRRLGRTRPAEGAAMIQHLMRYLRAAVPQARRATTTIGEEFELADAYLRLLKLRMGDRLRFAIEAPPALRALPFPPMTVLTLLENAIRHGIEPRREGGRIDVLAQSAGGRLLVTVSDDGVGLSRAKSTGSGVGLVNVQRQLKASYGRGALLELEANPAGGTTARLSVPLRRPAAFGSAPCCAAGAPGRSEALIPQRAARR